MLNEIAIGLTATLDIKTRSLTRLSDGSSVVLPASACLCLQALTDAQGEVLSQEQLMDAGWRSMGVEVTDNSVRVMINKLRRALNDLDLQDAITLLAVTRSGYRLIIRDLPETQAPLEPAAVTEPEPVAFEPAAPQPEVASQPVLTTPPAAPAPPPRQNWPQYTLWLAAGVLMGTLIGLAFTYAFIPQFKNVDFVHWAGPGIPPGTEIWVQKDKVDQDKIIEATLDTYMAHVVTKRPNEPRARVLYITIGHHKNGNFQGLIACHNYFKETNNDCESYYFRLR